MKILYIGNKIEKINGGGDQVNLRNQRLLTEISGGNIAYIPPRTLRYIDHLYLGMTDKVLKQIEAKLSTGAYTHIFFAQSLYGRAVKFVKKLFPTIEIITFFHNVEIDYAREYRKVSGMRALPFYFAVKKYEQLACKYSDKMITLNGRDSRRLFDVYGVNTACELPTSFDDCYDKEKALRYDKGLNSEITYLFVGIAFFPNIEGVQWFISNVLPHVKGTLYVVGKGMDSVQYKGDKSRFKVFGYVDDLSEFYYKARFIVSPIFSGAGMKTKTAEALMYGKTILGTTEAFEGYELMNESTYLCNSKDEWINIINKLYNKKSNMNSFSREMYIRKHCTKSLIKVLNDSLNL